MDPMAEEEWVKEECGPDGADVEEERGTCVVEEEWGASILEEQGTNMKAHLEDVEEGVRWRADAVEERAPAGVGKWQG
jgi:hypothetical protein